jgi:AbrB family looped-hinge helix DNA binding protein
LETRISSKGQITIPIEARKKLFIKNGDILKISITEEGLLILVDQTKTRQDPAKMIEVLHKTSGIWEDMEESGEVFVHRLRNQDSERWKALGIE